MINLVPMAGKGSRFKQEGYNLPKPFIPIMNMPMFAASVKSFPKSDSYIFICLEDFLVQYPFEKEVNKFFKNSSIIGLNQVTEGQASTCLLAEKYFNKKESLLISSIDYQVIYNQDSWKTLLEDDSIDVIIWTFKTGAISKKDPKAFAYCKRKENSSIVEKVVEKEVISETPHLDPAVVGTFYYKDSSDFVLGAKTMIEKNIRVNNEFYVGTSINQLIDMGKKVVCFPIDKFVSFGDPFELELYQFWEDFFYNLEDHPYQGIK